MSRKERLLNVIRTAGRCESLTLVIDNMEMKRQEHITFFNEDFEYKSKYIDETYTDNLRHKYSKCIAIDGIIKKGKLKRID